MRRYRSMYLCMHLIDAYGPSQRLLLGEVWCEELHEEGGSELVEEVLDEKLLYSTPLYSTLLYSTLLYILYTIYYILYTIYYILYTIY